MKKLDKLEWLRGFASVYVALGHWVLVQNYIPAFIRLFFRFGQEAVIIFFILSGFVIYYSYQNAQGQPLISYYLKRFRRIYFPFICALLVSYILVDAPFNVVELAGNLLMLQDFGTVKPGNVVAPFLGNNPLWSLSYEWTFYLIFPLVYLAIKKRQWQVHFIGLFCLLNMVMYILYPHHLFLVFAYFIIWWTGLELGAYFFGDGIKTRCKILMFYYILILGVLLVKCLLNYRQGGHLVIGAYPFLMLRHFCFTFICLVCAFGFTGFTKKIVILLRPFGYIAPISYSIYILHYPILIQAHFGLPVYVEYILKFALLISLAWLIEVVLQPVVNKYVRYGTKSLDS